MGATVLEPWPRKCGAASDLPPLRAAIRRNRLPPDAPDAWRDAIRAILGDPGRYVKMAQAYAAPVARRFNADHMADRYAEEYQLLVP